MNISLLFAQNKQQSFCHAIVAAIRETLEKAGHSVTFHDLYAEKFDPVLPEGEESLPEEKVPQQIRDYGAELKAADGIIVVHPNWWGSPPAILRGWIERVIRHGIHYNFTPNGAVSHMGDKIVQIFTTSNSPPEVEFGINKDPVGHYWEVLVFGVLGFKSYERRNFAPVILSTPEERTQWLDEVRATTARRFQ